MSSAIHTAAELAVAAGEAAAQGDVAEAEGLARRAIDLVEALPTDPDRDRVLAGADRALGTALRARARYAEAEGAFLRALLAAEGAFGADSVEAAEVLNDLGMTYKYAGRFAEADTAYGRVRTILESATSVDPADVATLLHNLGGLAHARGDLGAAEPLARRAIDVRSALAPSDDPALLLDRSAYAAISTASDGPTRPRPRSGSSCPTSRERSDPTMPRLPSR